jgi:putative transposase
MSGQLAGHRRFRLLNIVDGEPLSATGPRTVGERRFCPGQIVDLSISGARVVRYLGELGARLGLPEEIVLDNGPEGTSRTMFEWSRRTGVRLALHRARQARPERLRRKPERDAS